MTNAIPAPPTDTPYKLDESRVWEIRESHVSLPWDRFEFKRHDTIDDETPFPHDLADFDDEDLANDDDDDVVVVYSSDGCRGNGTQKPNRGEKNSSSPICLMAKASPTQAWLWHRRLSHLNFDYINLLSNKDVMIGLPKLKYVKDQLWTFSSCEVSKAKRSSIKTKAVPSSKGQLNLLHMDLCGPMRVASINGKKYILVIIDDYSRYTWTLFLRSKNETPEVLKDFLMMIQRNLQALVISVRTNRGTDFLNKTLNVFFKEQVIKHQTSTPRTPEQNGVVKILNRSLVEACRTPEQNDALSF
ncbi:retrovirus-related pol polyprotein from transposon TNT 1-94 [Tanacetum coccineum]